MRGGQVKHMSMGVLRELNYGDAVLSLGERTLVMGVLNLTPDSFSGDGVHGDAEAAFHRAMTMVEDGADIIDVGGESTRPGADPVGTQEEIDRVIPVVEELARHLTIPISVDTYRMEVARAALDAGAVIINDIFGLRDPSLRELIAARSCLAILMHMQGTPDTMQDEPKYNDVVGDIKAFFTEQVRMAELSGIVKNRLILDPGIGFGKTVRHNLEILHRFAEFKDLSFPLLIGTSRKSFISAVLGEMSTDKRLMGTVATVALAVVAGADIVRVHDVMEISQVVRMTDAISRYS